MQRIFSRTKGEAAASLGQQRPCLPQLGKKLLVECELKVRCPRTSSSTHPDANNPLHQLYVAQSPAHHQFVKLRQPLAHINPVAMVMLIFVEFVHGPGPGVESLPLGCTRAHQLQFAHRFESPEECVAKRWL